MKRNLILLSCTLLMANAAALAVDTPTKTAVTKTSATNSATKLKVPPAPSAALRTGTPVNVQTITPSAPVGAVPGVVLNQLITVGEGGPYTAKDTKAQRFADYVDLKKEMESAPLTFTLHNNGFNWFRVLLANQVIATEKSAKNDTVTVDLTGVIQPGTNQVVIQAGGKAGSTIDWRVTTVPQAKLERVSPDEALVGESVAIKGQHFALTPSANVVYFNNKTAKVTAAKATELKVTIPVDAEPGENKITAKINGVKTNEIKMKVRGIPSVSGTNLQGVPPGQTLMIFGKNFSKNLGENKVFFDETTAEVVSGNENQLTVVVPQMPFRAGHYPSQVRVQVGKVISKNACSVTVGPQMFTDPGVEVGPNIPEYIPR